MFCEKCGNEMLDTAKFCPSCGAVVEPAEEIPEAASVEETEAIPSAEPEEPVVAAAVENEMPKTETPNYGKAKDLTRPLSTASYFGMFFLMSLPIIRLIMLLVWSFSDNVNVNKRHFAHAVFIWVLVSLILIIVTTIVLFIVFGSTFYEMFIIW